MSAPMVWVDKHGWTRRIDEEGKAWRWQESTKEWVRDHERDVKR